MQTDFNPIIGMDINTFLEQQPKPEEILVNEDGSQYIPIGIVENLLDAITDKTWGTRNFTFDTHGGNGFFSASLELLFFDRVLVGTITFHETDYDDNRDYAAIAASECIKNAAKRLGNRFGRSLNRIEKKQKAQKESVKLKPDAKIMQQYNYALISKDYSTVDKIVSIYDIKIG